MSGMSGLLIYSMNEPTVHGEYWHKSQREVGEPALTILNFTNSFREADNQMATPGQETRWLVTRRLLNKFSDS